MEALTKELDSTKFKNNILYDRVYPLAKLNEFNQNQRIDTSNVAHFKQAVHELNVATNRKSTLFNAEDLQQTIYSLKNQNKVGVGIINCDFTVLKTNILETANPLIAVDGSLENKRYHEIATKNPYDNKQSLVVAVLQDRIEQGANPIVFSLKETTFQETTNPIYNLFVKFDDGQTTQLIANGVKTSAEFAHTFATSGIKNMEYYGTFQNGMPIKTMSTVTIYLPIQSAVVNQPTKCTSEIISFRVDELFTPYVPESLYIQPNATNINIDQRAKNQRPNQWQQSADACPNATLGFQAACTLGVNNRIGLIAHLGDDLQRADQNIG